MGSQLCGWGRSIAAEAVRDQGHRSWSSRAILLCPQQKCSGYQGWQQPQPHSSRFLCFSGDVLSREVLLGDDPSKQPELGSRSYFDLSRSILLLPAAESTGLCRPLKPGLQNPDSREKRGRAPLVHLGCPDRSREPASPGRCHPIIFPNTGNHHHRNRAVAGRGLGKALAAGSAQPVVQIKTSSFLFIIFP